jgi:hypothetical protein
LTPLTKTPRTSLGNPGVHHVAVLLGAEDVFQRDGAAGGNELKAQYRRVESLRGREAGEERAARRRVSGERVENPRAERRRLVGKIFGGRCAARHESGVTCRQHDAVVDAYARRGIGAAVHENPDAAVAPVYWIDPGTTVTPLPSKFETSSCTAAGDPPVADNGFTTTGLAHVQTAPSVATEPTRNLALARRPLRKSITPP